MTANTKTALAAILAADATIRPELAGFTLKLLGMGGALSPEDSAAILKRMQGKGDEIERVVRTKEACRILGVGVKSLRNWAKRGRLVPVYGGNERFRIGYTADSVRALVEGRATAAAV